VNRRTKYIYGISASVLTLIIIIDSKRAVSSVAGGINLCLQTVVPSLFPFFILSGIMNSCFWGQEFCFTQPLRRLCRIPSGSESVLLIGLFAGYPVGAKLVSEAYSAGSISKTDARRMLGFCSNAGPAFLFGMLSSVFSNQIIPWILWAIHIFSALSVGFLLPGGSDGKCILQVKERFSITKTLNSAIRNMATVCGWVVLFRLILDFLKKWFLWLLPTEYQVLVSGLIELSNGCIQLQQVQCEGARFILAAAMLAFGGMCVSMQTVSVTGKIGTGYYFPGKLLQMLLSITTSCLIQPLLFRDNHLHCIPTTWLFILICCTVITVYLFRRKKVVAFRRRMLYNTVIKCI